MLIQSQKLQQLAIASLHTSRHIDRVGQIILNPHDLSVAGFYLEQAADKILVTTDIRETDRTQAIIDSSDVLAEPDDLLRLKPVLELNFELISCQVRTKSGQKLGTVEDYIVDNVSWKIQKLHVKQPIWRNFTGGTLVIDRRQIVEVSDGIVIVEDALLQAGKLAPQQAP